jgi:hypothetical protein
MPHPRWVIVLVLAASGCSKSERTVDLKDLFGPYRVEFHDYGRLMAARPVVPDSREEFLIMKWLDDHSAGWRLDSTTPAPTREPARRIVGKSFDLDFSGEKCVLNYKAGPDEGWVQVSRPMRSLGGLPAVFASDH